MEREDYADTRFKCSRCGGMFDAYAEPIVQCPFCGMLCEETSCRLAGVGSETAMAGQEKI